MTPSALAHARHADACARGLPGYVDPETGLLVMSSSALAARGRCCGSGCRHCPWPADEQARAGRPPVPAWPWRRSPT